MQDSQSNYYYFITSLYQSDYGGEMWWCCGKSGIDAPGCKYSKHESKNEEEEDKDNLDDDVFK